MVVLPCCVYDVVRICGKRRDLGIILLLLTICDRFSLSPLLSEVQQDLGLTKQQIWTSSIAAVSGSFFVRFLLGPFVDRFGPRIPLFITLIASAIPTAFTGLVQSALGLTIVRFFIGLGGASFVMVQFW